MSAGTCLQRGLRDRPPGRPPRCRPPRELPWLPLAVPARDPPARPLLRAVGAAPGWPELWAVGWSSVCWVPRAMLVGEQVPEPEAAAPHPTILQRGLRACQHGAVGVTVMDVAPSDGRSGATAPPPALASRRASLMSVSASWVLLRPRSCWQRLRVEQLLC